jgi:hypothetical protein
MVVHACHPRTWEAEAQDPKFEAIQATKWDPAWNIYAYIYTYIYTYYIYIYI